jgi:hypothetical protein
MPLFFLQKQALGASGSAYRGPARAIRARGSSTGEFRRLADRQYHNRKQNPAADSLQIAHS